MTAQSRKNRESIIEVTLIDTEAFLKDVFDMLKKAGRLEGDNAEVDNISLYRSDMGYVETSEGLFLLSNEACCCTDSEDPLTEEGNRQRMDLYYNKGQSFSIIPSGALNMSRKDILEMPTKGRVNFGEWVRHFGHRIEGNFHNWNNFLTPIYTPKEEV